MKKLNLILITLFLYFISLNGICNSITLSKANTIATNFISTKTDKFIISLNQQDSSYFVFNICPKGFIIISSDDDAEPIQGYSLESNFVNDSTILKNTGIIDILKQKHKEIQFIKKHHIKGDKKIKDKWLLYSTIAPNSTIGTSVNALCQTNWNQGYPYNILCPFNYWAGCVAIAQAQIMKYWNYPIHGIGSYTYKDPCSGVILSANFANRTYHWSNPNSSDTIVYDIGLAVDMCYSSGGSGASMMSMMSIPIDHHSSQLSLVQNFGYNSNTIKVIALWTIGVNKNDSIFASQYLTWLKIDQYTSALKNELDNNRPIEYGGRDLNAGGHCWVVDGYDNNNLFHMNFGWGGIDNGYYSLSNINPSYNFSSQQLALIGIQPNGVITCNPIHQIQSGICPINSTGTIIQTRDYLCSSNTWTTWKDSINTCKTNPIPTIPVINKISRDSVYYTTITNTISTGFKYRIVKSDDIFGGWNNTGNKTTLNPYFLAKLPCCGNKLQLEILCYDNKGNLLGISLPYSFISNK